MITPHITRLDRVFLRLSQGGTGMTEEEEKERRIAKYTADEIFRRIYQEVGRGILTRVFWLAMLGALALAIWLGVIKVPPGT